MEMYSKNKTPEHPEEFLLSKAVKRLNKMIAAALTNVDRARTEYFNAQTEYLKNGAELDKARADYLRAEAALGEAGNNYNRAEAKAFWELFTNPNNRRKIWR